MRAPWFTITSLLSSATLIAAGLTACISLNLASYYAGAPAALVCWLAGGMTIGAGALLPLGRVRLGMLLGFVVQITIAILFFLFVPIVLH